MMAALWVLVGVILTRIYLLFAHQRHTPYLQLDLDSLPPLEEGLEALAGLTDGSVHPGNSVTVLQNGNVFDAMQSDIRAARHTIHLETFVWTKGKLEQQFV